MPAVDVWPQAVGLLEELSTATGPADMPQLVDTGEPVIGLTPTRYAETLKPAPDDHTV